MSFPYDCSFATASSQRYDARLKGRMIAMMRIAEDIGRIVIGMFVICRSEASERAGTGWRRVSGLQYVVDPRG
jgi:hypothetical protein